MKSFVEVNLEMLEAEFEQQAKMFSSIMKQGGGINSIHMENVLRSLLILYTRIAAHREAIRYLRKSKDEKLSDD